MTRQNLRDKRGVNAINISIFVLTTFKAVISYFPSCWKNHFFFVFRIVAKITVKTKVQIFISLMLSSDLEQQQQPIYMEVEDSGYTEESRWPTFLR